jgi:predicted DNA-binding transcriptional regulator AlpA
MSETIDPLLPADQVRVMFGGVSSMWLHRRLRDDSGFPAPIFIEGLRYWRKSEIDAWIAQRPRENEERRGVGRVGYRNRALRTG